jgi:hypothetical protein
VKPEYRSMMNGQGINHLEKALYTPSTSLEIGCDHYMGHYSMLVHHENKRVRIITPEPSQMPYEQVQFNLQNSTISDKDFPHGEYLGDAIMGI